MRLAPYTVDFDRRFSSHDEAGLYYLSGNNADAAHALVADEFEEGQAGVVLGLAEMLIAPLTFYTHHDLHLAQGTFKWAQKTGVFHWAMSDANRFILTLSFLNEDSPIVVSAYFLSSSRSHSSFFQVTGGRVNPLPPSPIPARPPSSWLPSWVPRIGFELNSFLPLLLILSGT